MDPEVVHLLRQGQKIAAIKRFREVYGSDLRTAKEAVDALEEGRQVALPSILAPRTLTEVASDPSLAEIDALVRANHKIDAIRIYRQRYNVGLKEAKDAIEAWPTGAGPLKVQRPQFESGGFVLEVGPSSGTPPPALPHQLPPIQYPPTPSPPTVSTSPTSAQPCAGHIEDRNVGQAIDLALNMGRREEALALYMDRYGVARHEAERQIDARVTGMGAGAAKTGCFIATAAYGTHLAPEVQLLRRFRDRVLRRSRSGRIATRLYYRLSPRLARSVERSPVARAAVRGALHLVLPSTTAG
jgi:ribosomal protein L7/L12